MKIYSLLLLLFIPLLLFAQADTIHSFSLEEALQYAVNNSYNTRLAEMNIKQSRKKITETTAIGLPQITGDVSYQNFTQLPVTMVPAEFFGGPSGEFADVVFGLQHNATADITGSQLIFDGSYFVGLQAARIYLDLSKNQLIKEKSEIQDAVTRSYNTAVVATENLKILKINKNNLNENLVETEQFQKVGFLEEQDVDQLRLLVLTMENQVKNAERQVKLTYNLLKFHMGIKLTEQIELINTLDDLTEKALSMQIYSGEYDPASNIDFQLINTNERLSFLNMKNMQAGYMPRLSGFMSHRQQAFRNEFTFLQSNQEGWFPATVWGLNLQVPVFTSFMTRAKVQQARIEWEKSKLKKDEMAESIRLAVEKVNSDYALALESLSIEKENLHLAKKIRDRTQVKYKEGISTSLELSQAENQFLQTQGNYIRSILQLLNTRSELDKLLGTYQ